MLVFRRCSLLLLTLFFSTKPSGRSFPQPNKSHFLQSDKNSPILVFPVYLSCLSAVATQNLRIVSEPV